MTESVNLALSFFASFVQNSFINPTPNRLIIMKKIRKFSPLSAKFLVKFNFFV